MNTSSIVTQRNYWACIPISLEDVAARIGDTFGLVDPDFGAEDPEEWFEGWSIDRISFYVYRQGGQTAPLRFIIKPDQVDPTEFGRRLAICFSHPISYGDVTYLGDDRYSFSEHSRYGNEFAEQAVSGNRR
jgi:hypothetical protein